MRVDIFFLGRGLLVDVDEVKIIRVLDIIRVFGKGLAFRRYLIDICLCVFM